MSPDANLPPPAPNGPATDDVLHNLIDDADRVCRVAMRMGRLNEPTFLPALTAAKVARDSNVTDYAAIAALQKSLSALIASLAPITFVDLLRWDPFAKGARRSVAALA